MRLELIAEFKGSEADILRKDDYRELRDSLLALHSDDVDVVKAVLNDEGKIFDLLQEQLELPV